MWAGAPLMSSKVVCEEWFPALLADLHSPTWPHFNLENSSEGLQIFFLFNLVIPKFIWCLNWFDGPEWILAVDQGAKWDTRLQCPSPHHIMPARSAWTDQWVLHFHFQWCQTTSRWSQFENAGQFIQLVYCGLKIIAAQLFVVDFHLSFTENIVIYTWSWKWLF